MTTTHRKEELTPIAQEIVPALEKRQKIERRSPALKAMIWMSIAAIFAAGIYAFAYLTTTDDVLRETGSNNSRNITGLQEQMKGVCRKVSNPNQLTPEERDGCYRAENSIPPSSVTITEQPNITINGLTAAEAQDMINKSVATLPKPLTVDQVTAAATAVYQANKPQEFTLEDIRQQVVLFCGINQCQGERGVEGKPGEDGKDAPPATPQEVYDQVNLWCGQESQPCRSMVKGDTGAQGVGIAAIERHCELNPPVLRFVFDKPNVNDQTFYDVQVSTVMFCTL